MFLEQNSKRVEQAKELRSLIKLKIDICIYETIPTKEIISAKKRKWNKKKRGLRRE